MTSPASGHCPGACKDVIYSLENSLYFSIHITNIPKFLLEWNDKKYQLNDNDLPQTINNDFNMQDFLASTKYNWKNISLDPFQVIWLGSF